MDKIETHQDYNKDLDIKQYPINPNSYESHRLTNIVVEHAKQHPEIRDVEEIDKNHFKCLSCYDSGVGIRDNGIDPPKLFICACVEGDSIFH